jgi:hypothetical protein
MPKLREIAENVAASRVQTKLEHVRTAVNDVFSNASLARAEGGYGGNSGRTARTA